MLLHAPGRARWCAVLLLASLGLAGCFTDGESEQAAEQADAEAAYVGDAVAMETEVVATTQTLNATLGGYMRGEASRAQALSAIEDARSTYERHLERVNATTPPPGYEAAHENRTRMYRLGIASLDAAERCLSSFDYIACGRAQQFGQRSLDAHESYVEALPFVPEGFPDPRALPGTRATR